MLKSELKISKSYFIFVILIIKTAQLKSFWIKPSRIMLSYWLGSQASTTEIIEQGMFWSTLLYVIDLNFSIISFLQLFNYKSIILTQFVQSSLRCKGIFLKKSDTSLLNEFILLFFFIDSLMLVIIPWIWRSEFLIC
jgi:hypothetical protein